MQIKTSWDANFFSPSYIVILKYDQVTCQENLEFGAGRKCFSDASWEIAKVQLNSKCRRRNLKIENPRSHAKVLQETDVT